MDTSTLPVVAPSDAEYAADVGYNRIVAHRPRLVVGARTTSDVVAAVRYAAGTPGSRSGSRPPATASAFRPTGCW